MIINNNNFPIGLDISDLNFKFCQLIKKRDKIRISCIGKTHLTKGIIQGGRIMNKKAAITELKKSLNNPQIGKITTNKIVACLPEPITFLKLIEIDKSPNNLKSIIEAEMEKHIPYPTNEIYYDWQIIKSTSHKHVVLIGACPKKIVDEYLDFLYSLKFDVVALEIEASSISRSLLAEEHNKFKGNYDKNYAILDLGAQRSSIIIYGKNTILFTSSLPISGNAITEEISRTLEIDFTQAEKSKIICGFDKTKANGIVYKILSKTINSLIKKMNQSFEYYKGQYPDNGPINRIILTGGGANIKDLDAIIAQETSIETIVGNPLLNLDAKHEFIGEINKTLKNSQHIKNNEINITFATSIGLALRNIFTNEF